MDQDSGQIASVEFGDAVVMAAWYRMHFHASCGHGLPSHGYVATAKQSGDFRTQQNDFSFVLGGDVPVHGLIHGSQEGLISLRQIRLAKVNQGI